MPTFPPEYLQLQTATADLADRLLAEAISTLEFQVRGIEFAADHARASPDFSGALADLLVDHAGSVRALLGVSQRARESLAYRPFPDSASPVLVVRLQDFSGRAVTGVKLRMRDPSTGRVFVDTSASNRGDTVLIANDVTPALARSVVLEVIDDANRVLASYSGPLELAAGSFQLLSITVPARG